MVDTIHEIINRSAKKTNYSVEFEINMVELSYRP